MKHPYLVKTHLLGAAALTVMGAAMLSPGLPAIAEHFSRLPDAAFYVRLMLTMPALFVALGAPFFGIVIERAGRIRPLAAALVLYALGGGAGLFSDNIYVLLTGRALLGIGIAGVMTIGNTLVGDLFEGDEQRRFLGLQSAFVSYGGMVFLGLGGWLADLSWRAPFLPYLVSLILLPGVLFLLPRPGSRPSTLRQGHMPATVWWVLFMAFISVGAYFALSLFIPFTMKTLLKATGTTIGMALSLSTFASGSVSLFIYGRAVQRFGINGVFALGSLSTAAGFALLSVAAGYPGFLIGLVLAGAGTGFFIPNLTAGMLALMPGASRGRGMGRLTSIIFLGQFLSPIFWEPFARMFGFEIVFRFSAGGFILLFVISWVLARRKQ